MNTTTETRALLREINAGMKFKFDDSHTVYTALQNPYRIGDGYGGYEVHVKFRARNGEMKRMKVGRGISYPMVTVVD